jgi:hypothetical protein
MIPKARRFVGFGFLVVAAALTVGSAIVIRREVGSRMGPKQTTQHPGVGTTIAAFPVGTRMADVKARLGVPDGQQSDGTYTSWSYVESHQREGWTREGLTFSHYRSGTQIEHKLLFRGDELFFARGSDVEVGTWNREVLWAQRRLAGPIRYPAVPLANGTTLDAALSSIVDGTTTLAQVEALLGAPEKKRQIGGLLNLVYRVTASSGGFTFVINLRDGIVAETPYSPAGTLEDEERRELFREAHTWPELPASSQGR